MATCGWWNVGNVMSATCSAGDRCCMSSSSLPRYTPPVDVSKALLPRVRDEKAARNAPHSPCSTHVSRRNGRVSFHERELMTSVWYSCRRANSEASNCACARSFFWCLCKRAIVASRSASWACSESLGVCGLARSAVASAHGRGTGAVARLPTDAGSLSDTSVNLASLRKRG